MNLFAYTGGSSLVSESEYDLIVSKLGDEAELDSGADINVEGDVDSSTEN